MKQITLIYSESQMHIKQPQPYTNKLYTSNTVTAVHYIPRSYQRWVN